MQTIRKNMYEVYIYDASSRISGYSRLNLFHYPLFRRGVFPPRILIRSTPDILPYISVAGRGRNLRIHMPFKFVQV